MSPYGSTNNKRPPVITPPAAYTPMNPRLRFGLETKRPRAGILVALFLIGGFIFGVGVILALTWGIYDITVNGATFWNILTVVVTVYLVLYGLAKRGRA